MPNKLRSMHSPVAGAVLRSHSAPATALAALLFALCFMLLPGAAGRVLAQTPTPEPKPLLDLDKSIGGNLTEVKIGEIFEYVLAFSCTSVSADCENAQIVDVLPANIEYVSYVGNEDVKTVVVNGQTVTITFQDQYGNPVLPAGSSDIVRLLVRFRTEPAPGALPGATALNTATFSASNADSVTDQAPLITATGQFEMTVDKSLATEAVVGEPITFDLKVCSPNPVGGVPLGNPVVVDKLPPGATFVSAGPGSSPADWVYNPTDGTVTFNNLPDPLPARGCYTSHVTVIYDELPQPAPVTQTNRMELTGTPVDCEVGVNPLPGYCNGAHSITRQDSVDFTLVEPFPRTETDKSATADSSFNGTEALPGEMVQYTLRVRNTGYVTYTNMFVTETIPSLLNFSSITFSPAYTPPITGAYATPLVGGFAPIPGSPFTQTTTIVSPTLGIAPANPLQALAWQLGLMPRNAEWTAVIRGTVALTATPGMTFTNCLNTAGAIGDAVATAGQDCATTAVIDKRSIPRIEKSFTPASEALPGAELTFRVRVFNAPQAHLPVIDPIMTDLVPVQYEVVPGSFRVVSQTSAPPQPTNLQTLPDFANGQTLLRATWAGGAVVLPGEEVIFTYKVIIKDGTPPGAIVNRAELFTPNDANPLACSGEEFYEGDDDRDGDGIAGETGCQSKSEAGTATVGVQLSAGTQKYIRSIFTPPDQPEWNTYATTEPGGVVDYRLQITNTSNVSISNIMLLDIFPYVGDKGVIDPSPRGSAWTPNLIRAITGPPGVPLTVFYSASSNPCRTQFVPSGPAGCEPGAWSRTFPENPVTQEPDPTQVRSALIILCEMGATPESPRTNCYVQPRNDTFNLIWSMTAPVGAPADPSCADYPPASSCPVGWNSFAFTASGGGLNFRPTEPPKVGVGVKPATTLELGDFVWLDVAGIQGDGIQQPTEIGINNVPVLAQGIQRDAVVRRTVTGNDAVSRPGYYGFSELPSAAYSVAFGVPTGALISPAKQGGDPELDSDGTVLITSTNQVTISTSIFSLITDTHAVDQGFWYPTDYGDAPFDNSRYFYPTSALQLQALGGNPALAARNVIGRIRLGAHIDDEMDGAPGPDARNDDFVPSQTGRFTDTVGKGDEDGVTFPSIQRTVIGPSGPVTVNEGLLVAGQSSPVTIVLSMPPTITAYVRVWIDYNRDGDWDDAGELVATDLSRTGSGAVVPTINVPATATLGTTYVRVRANDRSGFGVRGTLLEGEVEDYRIQIIGPPAKTVVATSEAHTTGNNLAIGEIVRYQVRAQLPEGRLENFRVLDNIPNGMIYLNDGSLSVAFTSTTTISGTLTPQVTDGPFDPGTDVTFAFGTLDNGDSDGDLEYVSLTFNVLLANTNVGGNNNQAGTTRTNSATVYYGTATATVSAPAVRVVEPVLGITKTVVAPVPRDAGDPITYRIVANYVTGSDRATAFNGVISDTISSYVAIGGITAVATGGAAVTPPVLSGNAFTVGFDSLVANQTVVITVTGRIVDNVPDLVNIPNKARLTWTSLPGAAGTAPNPTGSVTPGASGAGNGERNGDNGILNSGLLNDYRVEASVVTTLAGAPQIVKLQPPPTYTIGSPFTYTLVITMPEGVLNGVSVVDNLPKGLRLLGQQVVTTAAASGGLLAADFAGSFQSQNVVTATAPSGGTDITWTFGQVQNPGDNVPNSNRFLIRLQVVVLNIIENQDGVALVNRASLNYLNPNTGANVNLPTAAIAVGLLEPKLDIFKTAVTASSAPDAGDVVTYVVTFRHAADSHWPAYNVLMVDTVPTGLQGATVKAITSTGIAAPTSAFAGSNLTIPATGTLDVMPLGSSVTVTYVATIADFVRPGAILTNTAGVIWASLPVAYSERRWDGVGTPNGQDLITGNALNNYEANAQARVITVGTQAISKALAGTSAAHTLGSDVTIGEVVTYSLQITLSEGTYNALQVVDNLPEGLAYVGGSGRVLFGAFVGTLPPPTITPPGDGVSGGDVTFSFGATVVAGDNLTATNSFTLQLRARVLDVPGNVGLPPVQTVLTNRAALTVEQGAPLPSNLIDVRVVEPQTAIAKSITPHTVRPNDIVTVTLVISNYGTSTGFEVEMADPLPAPQMSYEGGLTEVVSNTAAAAQLTVTGNTVRATWAQFPAGTSSTLRFQARMGADLPPFTTISNTATVSNATTLPGADAGERTEPPDHATASVLTITPDVSARKANDVEGYAAGQTLVYTITVANNPRFPIRATGVVVTETVPTATSFDAAASTPGWLNAQSRQPCAQNSPAGTACIFQIGAMGIAEFRTLLFAVRVDSPLPDPAPSIRNAVCVGNDSSNGGDPAPDNNCSSVTTPFLLAQLGDYMWEDLNHNGIQEAGEPPLANVEVHLLPLGEQPTAAGAAGLVTTTNAQGFYHFTNLEPGQYQVQFVTPPGFLITRQNQGGNPALDSDAGEADGLTAAFALESGQVDHTVDAGYFRTAQLGDRAWVDKNGNGIQDEGEVGLPGVVITLYAEPAPVAAAGAALVPISVTTTNANGNYIFTGLLPGAYQLAFAPPAEWLATLPNVGSDDSVDSDVDPATLRTQIVTLQSNQSNLTLDGGFFRLGRIGRYVWLDENMDGIRQDEEATVSGVTVRLFMQGADGALAQVDATTTDGSGHFLFADRAPGVYLIEVGLPEGFVFTLQNAPADVGRNSDVDPITGRTVLFALSEGQVDETWGAGLVVPTSTPDVPEPELNGDRIYLPAVSNQ